MLNVIRKLSNSIYTFECDVSRVFVSIKVTIMKIDRVLPSSKSGLGRQFFCLAFF